MVHSFLPLLVTLERCRILVPTVCDAPALARRCTYIFALVLLVLVLANLQHGGGGGRKAKWPSGALVPPTQVGLSFSPPRLFLRASNSALDWPLAPECLLLFVFLPFLSLAEERQGLSEPGVWGRVSSALTLSRSLIISRCGRRPGHPRRASCDGAYSKRPGRTLLRGAHRQRQARRGEIAHTALRPRLSLLFFAPSSPMPLLLNGGLCSSVTLLCPPATLSSCPSCARSRKPGAPWDHGVRPIEPLLFLFQNSHDAAFSTGTRSASLRNCIKGLMRLLEGTIVSPGSKPLSRSQFSCTHHAGHWLFAALCG